MSWKRELRKNYVIFTPDEEFLRVEEKEMLKRIERHSYKGNHIVGTEL